MQVVFSLFLILVTSVLLCAQQGTDEVSNPVFTTLIQSFAYDRDLPTTAEIIDRQEVTGGTREKLVIYGPYMEEVPAYLTYPNSAMRQYPVILIIDGIYGSKERWFREDSWPRGSAMLQSLLRAGFAVLVMDAVNHGERASDFRYREPPWLYTYPHAFSRMIIQTGIEYRRAMDYLSTRKDLDMNNVGIMGLSMGGMITFPLAAIDERIKSAVAGLTPNAGIPALQPADSRIYAPHLLCESFLMFMGNEDHLYTMDDARRMFSTIQVNDKQFIEYNTSHALPEEYIKDVTQWFESHLKE